jgi:thiol-disulfide isomerase/thioredoxin
MEPAFEKSSKKFEGKVRVFKINIDEAPEVGKACKILSIPSLIGYLDGKEVVRVAGMQSEERLDALFSATLNGSRATILPIDNRARILRSILGILVIVVGWLLDQSILLMILGGLIVFSGFYDRCPIVKAVWSRINQLITSR